VNSERFTELVAEAVAGLPEEFRIQLENIDIVVAERPSRAQLADVGLPRGQTLLGLYQGVPLTRRGGHYGMVTPDIITIFRKPIEASCRSDREVVREVRDVVRHEIAHHFGISDARLDELEGRDRGQSRRRV